MKFAYAVSQLRSPDADEGNTAVAEVQAPEAPKEVIITNPTTGVEEKHFVDDEDRPYIIKDGVRLTLNKFTGANAGLMFYAATFENLDAAVQLHGAPAVLDALNDSMLSGTRRKVKRSKIPAYEDSKAQEAWVEKTKKTEPIQFSQEEALAYKPGEKELSSNQITREINDAIKRGAKRSELAKLMTKLGEVIERERQRRGFEDEDEDES